ncbi:MAG: hypothetical protein JSU94_10320 [Phycisphaerales bacterium]|nr:MAG: hypothetical protein JSU94_10320 [Phycisphaerales bacterium]
MTRGGLAMPPGRCQALAAGNPARVVKKRFDKETIERLLKVQPWKQEAACIAKVLPMLLNNEIGGFLQAPGNNEI